MMERSGSGALPGFQTANADQAARAKSVRLGSALIGFQRTLTRCLWLLGPPPLAGQLPSTPIGPLAWVCRLGQSLRTVHAPTVQLSITHRRRVLPCVVHRVYPAPSRI